LNPFYLPPNFHAIISVTLLQYCSVKNIGAQCACEQIGRHQGGGGGEQSSTARGGFPPRPRSARPASPAQCAGRVPAGRRCRACCLGGSDLSGRKRGVRYTTTNQWGGTTSMRGPHPFGSLNGEGSQIAKRGLMVQPPGHRRLAPRRVQTGLLPATK
jgi:hypothetical protein